MRRLLPLLWVLACSRSAPPVVGHVADFKLTDQAGKPFGTADLQGRVWIANFIFTRCTTVCPIFTEKMARLEEKAPGEIRFVSFSVDPEYDTPAILTAYAQAKGADLRRWSFLTGPIAEVQKTVQDSMKIAIDKDPGATDPGMAIMHGTYFVLVDGKGQIRGIYAMSDESAGKKILDDAGRI